MRDTKDGKLMVFALAAPRCFHQFYFPNPSLSAFANLCRCETIAEANKLATVTAACDIKATAIVIIV